MELDRERLEALVSAVVDRLEGDWLLVGGALVALWLSPRRVTEDVDLIGLAGTAAQRTALFNLAFDLGLPVETLNSAADFFVERIEGWRSEIEPFQRGAKGTVFRPSPTLFVLLKAARLSEQDLEDCLAAVALARRDRLPLNGPRIVAFLAALSPTRDPELAKRRTELELAVIGPSHS